MSNKIRHLEFIQDVIKRMAGNSFLLRGWSVTLIIATFAIAGRNANFEYVIIAFALVIIFWMLDGYYLSQERLFRDLYDEVRIKDDAEIDFSMKTKSVPGGKSSWLCSMFSSIFLVFYGGIFILLLVVTAIKYIDIGIIINFK